MEFRSKIGHWIADLAIRKTPLVLSILVIIIVALGYKLDNFRLDASADSLLLENDPALTAYRKTYLEYGSDDYLFLLFDPEDELFTKKNLKNLADLQEKVVKLSSVRSVTSILDIPLFDPQETDIFTVEQQTTTLREGKFELDKAKAILTSNPIYKDLIISKDGSLTALQVNLEIPDQLKTVFGN